MFWFVEGSSSFDLAGFFGIFFVLPLDLCRSVFHFFYGFFEPWVLVLSSLSVSYTHLTLPTKLEV